MWPFRSRRSNRLSSRLSVLIDEAPTGSTSPGYDSTARATPTASAHIDDVPSKLTPTLSSDPPPPRLDPRLTPRHRNHSSHRTLRALPNEVLAVICSASPSSSTLASLALLDKAAYGVVTPYLYRTVTITRHNLHKVLYPLPIPKTRHFIYVPERTSPEAEAGTKAKAKTKNLAGHPESSGDSIARKRWCLSLSRVVNFKGEMLDWGWSSTLAEYFDDPVPVAPDRYSADSADTEPTSDHTRRDSQPATPATRLPYLPNAHTLLLPPEVIHGLVQWSFLPSEASRHPFFRALKALLPVKTLEITGGISSTLGTMHMLPGITLSRFLDEASTVLEMLYAELPLARVVLHGVTNDSLPALPGITSEVHYVPFQPPRADTDFQLGVRIKDVAQSLKLRTPCAAGRRTIIGIGGCAIQDRMDPTGESARQDQAINHVAALDGIEDPTDVWWVTTSEAHRLGLAASCGCYGTKRQNRVVLDDGVQAAYGVRRGIWRHTSREITWAE